MAALNIVEALYNSCGKRTVKNVTRAVGINYLCRIYRIGKERFTVENLSSAFTLGNYDYLGRISIEKLSRSQIGAGGARVLKCKLLRGNHYIGK